MTIYIQSNSKSDNIYQAIPSLKKPWSIPLTSLANDKNRHFRYIYISIIKLKKNEKYNQR